MNQLSTRDQRSADRRRRLLDAAERVYWRSGDLGLTVRRIAAEASTTSQTIYTYFGSRDTVVESMFQRFLDEFDRLLTRMEGQRRDEAATDYRSYCLANPTHFLMLIEGRGPGGTDPDEIARRRDALFRRLTAGQPTRPDPAAPAAPPADGAAQVTMAAINGFIHAELHNVIDEPHRPDKLFDDLMASLGR